MPNYAYIATVYSVAAGQRCGAESFDHSHNIDSSVNLETSLETVKSLK